MQRITRGVAVLTSDVRALLRTLPPTRALLGCVLAALLLWAYWPTLGRISQKWLHDPQYSHGYLVPAFAAALLWLRRSHITGGQHSPSPWGLALMTAGALLRLASVYVYVDWLDVASLLPTLAGLFVLLGGWPALRWSWPTILFLLFMIPLPYRVETALSHPLQRLATDGSTYVMQTLGLPALAEGNTIVLDQGRIGVVEACNGLSMMLLFFALATGLAAVIRRPALDKTVILLSAVPIAVTANVLRITATGLAMKWWAPQAAMALYHDWAGWLMMPLALAILWLELRLLSRILISPNGSSAVRVPVPGPSGLGAIAAAAKPKSRRQHRPAALVPRPGRGG
jgi:exosortase